MHSGDPIARRELSYASGLGLVDQAFTAQWVDDSPASTFDQRFLQPRLDTLRANSDALIPATSNTALPVIFQEPHRSSKGFFAKLIDRFKFERAQPAPKIELAAERAVEFVAAPSFIEGRGIRVGTYNIGNGYADYHAMLKNVDPEEANQLSQQVEKSYSPFVRALKEELYKLEEKESGPLKIALDQITAANQKALHREIELYTAWNLSRDLDVICLQEVKKADRTFLVNLQAQGFDIHHIDGDVLDNAIAVRKGIFVDVRNASQSIASKGPDHLHGEDVAAVVLTLPDTGIKVAVASLHAPEFARYASGRPVDAQSAENGAETLLQKTSSEYVRAAFNVLEKQKADFRLMAGDMGASSENSQQQFSAIQKRRYTVLEQNLATCFKPSSNDKERIVDFIFFKQLTLARKIIQFIKAIFFQTYTAAYAPAEVLPRYSFAVGRTSSDHLPVATTISFQVHASYAKKAWRYAASYFKR